MALYKIVYTLRNGKQWESSAGRFVPVPDWELVANSKAVTILRDSQGEDHPDNTGKFFLYRIVK